MTLGEVGGFSGWSLLAMPGFQPVCEVYVEKCSDKMLYFRLDLGSNERSCRVRMGPPDMYCLEKA
jgi:hypothetical protein